MAGENDRSARRTDRNLLIGEDAVFFFGAGADVNIDAKVEAARALQGIPNNQRYFSGSLAMNQNLSWRYDLDERDRWVGD